MAKAAVPFLKSVLLNKRLPPMADKAALPYKLTVISRNKMTDAVRSRDPDLRRCIGHVQIHRKSLEWAQQEAVKRINAFALDEEEELEGTEPDEQMENRLHQLQLKRDPERNISERRRSRSTSRIAVAQALAMTPVRKSSHHPPPHKVVMPVQPLAPQSSDPSSEKKRIIINRGRKYVERIIPLRRGRLGLSSSHPIFISAAG